MMRKTWAVTDDLVELQLTAELPSDIELFWRACLLRPRLSVAGAFTRRKK